jgi:hypothetical protein
VRALLAIVLVVMAAAVAGCGDDDSSEGEREAAIDAAQRIFETQAETLDLDAGPCVSESLPGLPDWVADIAHEPRTDADDDPANQCERFRDGEASHFVELTPEGEVIRAE